MREILISLGYRETSKTNVFAKPVAFNIFIFEIDELRWTNWFTGANGEKLIWNEEIYHEDKNVKDDFLRHIKYCEAHTRLSDQENNLEFLTFYEKLQSIL